MILYSFSKLVFHYPLACAYTHAHTHFRLVPKAPCACSLQLRGSPIFFYLKHLYRHLSFHQSARPADVPDLWKLQLTLFFSSSELHSIHYFDCLSALSLLCLMWLLCLYMTEADVTRPCEPVGNNKVHSLPLSKPLHSFLGIFSFSHLLMTSSPCSSLPSTLTFASQTSHCWALVRILLLAWFSQIHKNLWCQRSPQLFKPHCVPCRNLEMTPLSNPESDFLPLDPKQYSSGLSTRKIHLKAISLASGCNSTLLKGKWVLGKLLPQVANTDCWRM